MVEESAYRDAIKQLRDYEVALLDIRKQLENIMIEIVYNIGNDTYVLRKIENLRNDSNSILLLEKEVELQRKILEKDLDDLIHMTD